MSARPPWRHAAPLPLGGALLLLLASQALARGPAREEFLAAELAAARSHRPYLVLEPRQSALDLKSEGFLLHRFLLHGALLGLPRWGGGPPVWPAVAFQLTSEPPEPERRPIPIQHLLPPIPTRATVAGKTPAGAPGGGQAGGAEAAPETTGPDPGIEEMKHLPTRYLLLFAPDLAVAVAGEAPGADLPASLWRLGRRLADGWQALTGRITGRPVVPRLLLAMSSDDARRLCLALRKETRLLIAVPETGR